MTMISGRRRPCLILIQTFTETDGQYGATVTWSEYCRAWVNIEPDRSREQYKSDERESVVTHTIRGDYMELSEVRATMRIIYNDEMEYGDGQNGIPSSSRVFEILAVMPAFNDRGDVMIKVEEEGRTYGEITG